MSAYQGLVTLPLSIPDNPSQLQSLPSGPGDAETAACSSADRGAVQVPVPHSGSAILPHSPGHQPPLPEPQGELRSNLQGSLLPQDLLSPACHIPATRRGSQEHLGACAPDPPHG